MRINLPDRFMDEYWDMETNTRKFVVASVQGYLRSQTPDETLDSMIKDGWSREFLNWLIPNVEKFRSEMEIDATPTAEDFDRVLNDYNLWKVRREINRRRWIIGVVLRTICTICLVLAVVSFPNFSTSGFGYLLVGIFLIGMIWTTWIAFSGMMRFKGHYPNMGNFLVSIIFRNNFRDENRMTMPQKVANHDEMVRLVEKVKRIKSAEKA